MYGDVEKYVKTCEVCQRKSKKRFEEELHPTATRIIWEKVGVDVVYMPMSVSGNSFAVFARDDLSGWVEGRALKAANSESVAKFLYEDVICRHGCPLRIVTDGGMENFSLTTQLLERYKLQRTVTSPYHPQSNGLVERGHAPIVSALAKYDDPTRWDEYLPLALWADRISVRRSTGYSAFELVYGRDCILPIEFAVSSWSMVANWEGITTREHLLRARMQQLDQRNLELTQAAENLRNSRRANKAYFDEHHDIRKEELKIGDLVLVYKGNINIRLRDNKLADRWDGPYRIRYIPRNSTYYEVEELDGVAAHWRVAGNRIKKFHSRDEIWKDALAVAESIRQRPVPAPQRPQGVPVTRIPVPTTSTVSDPHTPTPLNPQLDDETA